MSWFAGPTIKPQKKSAPQKHHSQNTQLDYNQDGSPNLSFMQSSWLIHPQSHSARFPIRAPYQPQASSHVPPSFHTHQFQLHHPPWPRQPPSGWASSQPNYPLSWTAGAAGIPSDSEALWGQLYMDEPPPERRDGAEASRAPSSKREISGGSRSSHLSQELDIKPGGKKEIWWVELQWCFLSRLIWVVIFVPSSSVQRPCREQWEQQGVQSGEQREEEEEREEITAYLHRQRKTQLSGVSQILNPLYSLFTSLHLPENNPVYPLPIITHIPTSFLRHWSMYF